MGRKLRWLLLILVLLAAGGGAGAWYVAYRGNVTAGKHVLLIPTGASFEQVMDSLTAKKILINPGTFKWVASLRSYSGKVKSGRYVIQPGMNNWDLVAKLRSGNQDAVKVRFNSHWQVTDVLKEISPRLELRFESLDSLMRDEAYVKSLGFDQNTLPCLFMPDTYEVFWDVSPQEFFDMLKRHYTQFWDKRKDKLEALHLTPAEVCAVASIVQRESAKPAEYATIAGLYLNRVRKGMKLEADPTLKFALGNFAAKRIYKKDLEVDSPFNTYKYAGIPPGPITNPEPVTIDAVLNAERHEYLFLCAKPDFSGYHNFAKTNAQHERNAAEYHAALNKARIR